MNLIGHANILTWGQLIWKRLPNLSSPSERSSSETSIHKHTLLHCTQTASSGSDVQSELSELGVSVYNQDEFEAGVLQQIDQEVSKRNAEQQKKFLLKEYNSVKHEIR